MKVVTFKLRDEELEELDRIARKLGMTRSDVIREAIRRFLSEVGTHPRVRVRVRRVVLY